MARLAKLKAVSAAAVTMEVRDAARALAPLAFETLADVMRTGGSDTARLAAAKEVLDRAHGKAKAGETDPSDGEGLTVVIRRFDEPDDEPSAA